MRLNKKHKKVSAAKKMKNKKTLLEKKPEEDAVIDESLSKVKRKTIFKQTKARSIK